MSDKATSVKGEAADNSKSEVHLTENTPLQVRIIESPADAKRTLERESKSDKHDTEDLDAQIRSAKATENQVLPTWLGAIFSFAGTGLLIWNLFVAEATLNETKSSNERQLRTYLGIKPIGYKTYFIEESGKRILEAKIRIKNYGQTPAYKFECGFNTKINERDTDVGWEIKDALTTDNAISPNQVRYIDPTVDLSLGEELMLRDGKLNITIWGQIVYTDAFGIPRMTSFRLKINDRVFDDERFIISVTGNDAT